MQQLSAFMGLLKWLAAALGSRHIARSQGWAWHSFRTCGLLPGDSTGKAGNTTWWYPVHDQGVGQEL